MKKKLKIIIPILITILIICFFLIPIISNYNNNDNVIVLAYHHFLDEKEKNEYESDNGFVISTKNFEEQLKYLKDNGYKSMTSKDLECYLKKTCKLKGKNVLITMDDGNISSYYKALPILEKYEYNSINFIIASRVKEKSEKLDKFEKYYFIGQDLIDDIRENHPSMEIGVHSYNLHGKIDGKSPLDVLTYEQLLDDTKKAKEILKSDVYCYPFGAHNAKLEKTLANSGFKIAFTFNPAGFVNQNNEIYEIPRVEVRGDYTLEDFSKVIKKDKNIIYYWKNFIKRIINS